MQNPVMEKEDSIVSSVQELGFPLIGIVLFGSRARSEERAGSDLDLLLVLEQDKVVDRSLYREWEKRSSQSMRDMKIEPQFVILPKDKEQAGGLWFEVAIDGKVLWERDQTVSHFLREVRCWMAEGKIQRRVSHGHPYWLRAEGKGK